MECIVSNHGADRIRERVGLPKKAVDKNVERAFEKGLKHGELSGGLRRFIDALYLEHRMANNIRIYCGMVYLFCGNVLVTVVPLPQKYRKKADILWKEKQNERRNKVC